MGDPGRAIYAVSAMKPISVLLVDDNSVFLDVASRFLQKASDGVIDVVGTAASGERGLALAPILRPQVILVDLNMPGLSGIGTIRFLRALMPRTGIIALSMLERDIYRQEALLAGADDYVPKSAMAAEIVPAIRRLVVPEPPKEPSHD